MADESSRPFRDAVRSFAGLTADSFDSLLCSLPSELVFNDLRDASRRHTKQEKTNPNNIHAVSLKSCVKRPSGCSTLDLEDRDWQEPLKGKTLKAKVHSALKPRDLDLGVDCEGLTRHRQNAAYTKPHVFCQRLRLLRLLQGCWESTAGDAAKRAEAVFTAHKNSWTSMLIPTRCFIQWQNQLSEDVRNMVLSSGPHALVIMPLKKIRDSNPVAYTMTGDGPRDPVLAGTMDTFKIALTAPVLSKDGILGWSQRSDFMNLSDYVADYLMLEITAQNLSHVCSALGLRGHTKLNHKGRIRCFLEYLKKDESFITDILDEVPEPVQRARVEAAPAADMAGLSLIQPCM